MSKSATLLGAIAAATLTSATVANAHSPHDVVHLLQDDGYSQIEFVDPNPPNYMANACKDGVRYHFHVDYYGQVTERSEIGSCESARRHNRWGGWGRSY